MFVLYTTIFVIRCGSGFKTEAFQILSVICWCTDSKQRCVYVDKLIRYNNSTQVIYCGKSLGAQHQLFLFSFCECTGRVKGRWKIVLRSVERGKCGQDRRGDDRSHTLQALSSAYFVRSKKMYWTSTLCNSVINIITVRFGVQQFYVLPTQCIYVICMDQNKERLFPYTALTDWFV